MTSVPIRTAGWLPGPGSIKRLPTRLVVYSGLLALVALISVIGPLVIKYDPLDLTAGLPLEPPSPTHPFGVDGFGRDEFSRVLSGIRLSLGVGVLVATVSLVVGAPIGLLLGYRGGRLDFVVSRFLELLFAFPSILLALVLTTALGSGMRTSIIAMCLIYLPQAIRFVRGVVADEAVKEYVVAARVLGASHTRIAFRHLLPNISSQLLVITTLIMSFAILTEAALSFLGLGAQAPSASLGRLVIEGRPYLDAAPHLAIAPALTIAFLVWVLNALGDAVRDHLKTERVGDVTVQA